MAKRFTRRQFLRSGLVVSAALGIGGLGLQQVSSQSDDATPESTPQASSPPPIELDGNIQRIHDPTVIKTEDGYYLFCTGLRIPALYSPDLVNWERSFPTTVFAIIPEWTQAILLGRNDPWAPDISYWNGKYHLYYSVSTFGRNRSAIGLATNVTLNSESDDFEWIDEGLVIESMPEDDYNCIDPNLVLDADDNPWLAFGSFWTGLKMRRLDPTTGKLSTEDDTLYDLAQRFVNSGAVEAPYIIRKGDYYYLFASFDSCCQGVHSTYYVVVGRSENVTGPYIDRDGVPMLEGGGTQVTFPTDRWRGPGHNAILQENDGEYIIYHAYDAENQGVPTLRIQPLVWDEDGFPTVIPAS